MKTLIFPARTGLAPRPYDGYDDACHRYWRACKAGNGAAAARLENRLADIHGCHTPADLDDAFGHGFTVSQCKIVTNAA